MNDQENLLFSYRVFGFGDKSRIIIDQFNSLDYPSLNVIQYRRMGLVSTMQTSMKVNIVAYILLFL